MPKPLGAEGSELPRRTDEGRPGQLELPVVPAGRAQNVTQRIRDGGQSRSCKPRGAVRLTAKLNGQTDEEQPLHGDVERAEE